MRSRKPPRLVTILPGASASGSWSFSLSHRSSGASLVASLPARRSSQNDWGSAAPPGKRQPIPTTARGSFFPRPPPSPRCRASSFDRSSRISTRARLSGESSGAGALTSRPPSFQLLEEEDFGLRLGEILDSPHARALLRAASRGLEIEGLHQEVGERCDRRVVEAERRSERELGKVFTDAVPRLDRHQ